MFLTNLLIELSVLLAEEKFEVEDDIITEALRIVKHIKGRFETEYNLEFKKLGNDENILKLIKEYIKKEGLKY